MRCAELLDQRPIRRRTSVLGSARQQPNLFSWCRSWPDSAASVRVALARVAVRVAGVGLWPSASDAGLGDARARLARPRLSPARCKDLKVALEIRNRFCSNMRIVDDYALVHSRSR
jgi:hypothetical protein